MMMMMKLSAKTLWNVNKMKMMKIKIYYNLQQQTELNNVVCIADKNNNRNY